MKHFTDWIIYGLFHRPLHFIFIAMCFSNISYFHLRTSHDHHNWRDNFCKRSYRSKRRTKAQVLRRNSGSVVNSCSVVNSGSLDTLAIECLLWTSRIQMFKFNQKWKVLGRWQGARLRSTSGAENTTLPLKPHQTFISESNPQLFI